MNAISVRLTDDEKAVIFGFASQECSSEVARDLGFSEQRVSQSVDDIVKKLQMGSILCALNHDAAASSEEEIALAAV